ncbi:MAG TPA: TIM44-like domain-containing protein [Anaeromyxobacter sp.]|nr:TIM44-like domain-containing protein [Anaeromyxobacter sp.]
MSAVPGRFRLLALAVALAASFPPATARARGGGGCLSEGTGVATPGGEVPVEALRPGDPVWAVVGGKLRQAEVMAVSRVEPEEYVELAAGQSVLRATGEHPVEIAPGVFRTASRLRPGDALLVRSGQALAAAPISSVRRIRADRPAFNLLVLPGGTYLAAGVAVHNKGCFLPDTPVSRPDLSEIPIASVRPGDELLAFTADGETVTTTVRDVLTHEVDEYVLLETEHTTLRVTPEHPFYVGDGTFKTVEALHVGDQVYLLSAGTLRPERIVAMQMLHARVRVFNLQTDPPNTFFAAGLAVHNKGGGGYHGGYHSGTGSGGCSCDGGAVVTFLLILGVILFVAAKKGRSGADLDFCYDRAAIERKAGKTRKLLDFLARVDAGMAPSQLAETARRTFLELQRCWEARDYGPMKPLLMPDLWKEHSAQLEGMTQNHEINRISDLAVESVDIVNARYPQRAEQREFTALFTARAQDHYVDDRTGAFLRGDRAPARFQEFWTFQRQGSAWLLREIEQTRESDALRQENFFEQFTDLGRDQVYGDQAGQAGPAGPWLEKGTADKATRIERMLAFLVQTDRLWDRQAMLERARQVFLGVTLARERGDPAAIPEADLFPEVAGALRADLAKLRTDGARLEFRNLCVRKVELILVRNFTDNAKDDFTVRISAHAQRAYFRGNAVRQDPDVTPFVEFWTFGRLGGGWKLKEVLPPARGEEAMAAENLDEDSSPEQVQWYYRQTRAR